MKKMKIVDPDRWIRFITTYAQREYNILPAECKGGVVIDCGCNIGDFEMNFKDRFDKYICFDVLEENIELLKNNLKDLSIDYEVEKRACEKEPGIMTSVYAHSGSGDINYFGNSGNVGTHLTGGWIEENKIDEVLSITIEEIFNKYGDIELLKFDIEGAEFNFLLDKDLSRAKFIIGEIHFDGDIHQSLVDHISKTHDLVQKKQHVYAFKRK
jgi:FkbM family methyltransferase